MQDNQPYKIKIKPAQVVLFLLAIVAIYYMAPQLIDFKNTINLLWHSSWIWLAVAIVATGLTFILSAIIQYMAGDSIGKISDLIRLGFAGSFLNHFLPFSVGGIGLITEYYRKLGQRRSRALVMATIPIVVGSIMTIFIIFIISPLTLIEVANNLRASYKPELVVLVGGICVVLVTLVSIFLRKRLKDIFEEAVMGLKSVRSFRQLAKVSGGSILLTLVAALVLYASIQAIHGHLSFVIVITIFITSLLISEVAPTPGGIGATEAVLVLGLTGAGLSAAQALSATLIFRFISFLLPLIPGVVAVVQLNRPVRKA
jgi:uncharacterized membrane protein YbhN (UPF0104 family)